MSPAKGKHKEFMATVETKHKAAEAEPLPTIEVYSTLSRTKAPLETVKPGHVGMYLCGPTVYKPSHIGHMVGPVIFDTVKRHLVYSGWDVTWSSTSPTWMTRSSRRAPPAARRWRPWPRR